ncbi:MAG: DUF6935 domain-containing protein, partial [Acutalibacteraceae bacterium]
MAEKISFGKIPKSLEEFLSLPQAQMKTPYETAALAVLALSVYPENKELSINMLDALRGPRPLNNMDKQFIADRFRGKEYLMRSYFSGSSPENDYTPALPYTVTVSENQNSCLEPNLMKLFVECSGADSPRPIQLRKAKDGKWYLWEQFLLTGIKQPESINPWA